MLIPAQIKRNNQGLFFSFCGYFKSYDGIHTCPYCILFKFTVIQLIGQGTEKGKYSLRGFLPVRWQFQAIKLTEPQH